jgi:hypothetical protein
MADAAIPNSDPFKIHLQRLFMGALAGVTASVVKYWSHDHTTVIDLIMNQKMDQLGSFWSGYGIGLAVLLFLGAISAWIFREYDFRKMFWVGLSAPSLLAAGIPPVPNQAQHSDIRGSLIDYLAPISSARADDNSIKCVGDDAFTKGVKTFFGVPPQRSDKYTVIVGSFKDTKPAQDKIKQINSEEPALKARIGIRSCSSDWIPVVVGDPLPLDEAKKVLLRVENLDSVSDAYLSPGPR